MKKTILKLVSTIIGITLLVSTLIFAGCNSSSFVDDQTGTNNSQTKINQFYEIVSESRDCLDEIADDIYTYWYNAIYKDYYSGNINTAIAYALSANEANVATVEANEPTIKSLYKEVRDTDLSEEIKDVMNAYSDYYEFVINVSGSFNTFSANKETLKKALSSALKSLELEL